MALLAPDAILAMPPLPLWLQGTDAIREFARNVLFAAPTMRDQRFAPAHANGLPALASYARDANGVYVPAALEVVVVRGGRIAELHAFLAIGGFIDVTRFGVPATL